MNLPPIALAFFLAAAPALPEGAVPVENEPQHKTVFKNDYIQAFRVTLEPGNATLLHTHSLDDAAVRLSTATTVASGPGRPDGSPETLPLGAVSARDNAAKAHTHRVHNIGSTLFDVINVQVLRRPGGPASPAIGSPAAENSSMRLYRYELEPGATTAQHSHTRPYLVVAATDATLLTTAPDGSSTTLPDEAGDMQWIELSSAHEIVNRGAAKAILVEFELK